MSEFAFPGGYVSEHTRLLYFVCNAGGSAGVDLFLRTLFGNSGLWFAAFLAKINSNKKLEVTVTAILSALLLLNKALVNTHAV